MTLVVQGIIDGKGNRAEVLNNRFSISYSPVLGFQLLVQYEEVTHRMVPKDEWVPFVLVLKEPEGRSILADIREAAFSKQNFTVLTAEPCSRKDVINALDRLLDNVK
jgi:hypothetical protein|tara:strand:- start:184 stop:504 length:321 start_codon:yes stop_codon:yes gene_type:complete